MASCFAIRLTPAQDASSLSSRIEVRTALDGLGSYVCAWETAERYHCHAVLWTEKTKAQVRYIFAYLGYKGNAAISMKIAAKPEGAIRYLMKGEGEGKPPKDFYTNHLVYGYHRLLECHEEYYNQPEKAKTKYLTAQVLSDKVLEIFKKIKPARFDHPEAIKAVKPLYLEHQPMAMRNLCRAMFHAFQRYQEDLPEQDSSFENVLSSTAEDISRGM